MKMDLNQKTLVSFMACASALHYKSVTIISAAKLWHNLSILESVAELRVQVFQVGLTVHDIDADSARGTTIITDDRSSFRFSDDEEVSVCIIMLQL